jgi:hypothetical protein
MTVFFTNEELASHAVLRSNQSFYREKYENKYKLYFDMDKNEKCEFIGLVKSSYYARLGLSDESLIAKPELLDKIAEFISEQAYVVYMSQVNRAICECFRALTAGGELSSEAKIIYDLNLRFITSLDAKQKERETAILAMVTVKHPMPQLALKPKA